MKYIITIVLMILSFSSFADCDFSAKGLTAQQKQQLVVQCEQMKEKTMNNNGVTIMSSDGKSVSPEDVSKWSGIAVAVAKALGEAAKQLNIGVNDFIKTPAGYLVVIVLLWKLLMKGLIAMVISTVAWANFLIYAKKFKIDGYESLIKTDDKGNEVKVIKPTFKTNYNITDGDWMVWWVYFGAAIASTIVMLSVS